MSPTESSSKWSSQRGDHDYKNTKTLTSNKYPVKNLSKETRKTTENLLSISKEMHWFAAGRHYLVSIVESKDTYF